MTTARSTMSPLGRRATVVTVGVLVGLAALAWTLTAKQALDMSGMVTGLGQVGSRMPNDMAAPLFMGMWLTMMVAMMFPTIAPMVLAHRMVVTQRGEGALPTTVFVLGYLAVWTAIGLVPQAAFLVFRNLTMETARSAWLPVVAGGVLVGAGLYQFTPLKGVCLKVCRTPLSFILTHDFGSGVPGAFRAGVLHGAYCLGCCWALMSVLVVMGLMNLVWMAALSLVFLAEKNWRRGPLLSKLAGSLIALLGAAVILHPALLSTLAE
jgi:predicted metal-binding membrane protein